MKRKLKFIVLVFGIFVAVAAFLNTNLYADTIEKEEIGETKILSPEVIELLERITEIKPAQPDEKKCMKFYNIHNQLVYESRDKSDARVINLLRRSDIFLQTYNSSYYLLD